jgi:hypothetical protein
MESETVTLFTTVPSWCEAALAAVFSGFALLFGVSLGLFSAAVWDDHALAKRSTTPASFAWG